MKLADYLVDVNKVAIAGHVRPDGDCVGSVMGMYNYIRDNFADIEVHAYLEEYSESLAYVAGIENAEKSLSDADFDLFIIVDTADVLRIGVAQELLKENIKTLVVDHHISNVGYGDINVIEPEASSACEVVYGLFEDEKISKNTAEALYTGMVHDSGVFKYQSTSKKTMTIAGNLIDKGIEITDIIDEGFYSRSYVQNQVLGKALMESILLFEGKCIVSHISRREMEFFGITHKDLNGIVEQLRLTSSVEIAVFIYQTEDMKYKVSLRSKKYIDCNRIAGYFGGGGHIRAAGCILNGTTFYDVINNITREIEKQI